MKFKTLLITAAAAVAFISCHGDAKSVTVTVGAARTGEYVDGLKGKKVALFSNQTGVVGGEHVLDLLLREGVDVVTIFSPEHGFRGEADAGESVSSSVDEKTGVRISSLYGSGFDYRDSANFEGIDVIISDIQDVGLRFYTYYVTMIKLMESAARFDKEFVVLDIPIDNLV